MSDKIIEINNTKYRQACRSDELREGAGMAVGSDKAFSPGWALFRHNGELYCFENNCPHRHSNLLHKGLLKVGVLTCPLHGWEFDLESGANVSGDGTRGIRKIKAVEFEGFIYIEVIEESRPKWMQQR
ncbi:MAG: Rieske (2Fe-2S) protein [Candidatus Kapaibacterium sp.]